MLTLHTAPRLRTDLDGAIAMDGAVAVVDGRIEAVGTLAELTELFPRARVRRWPGALGPALVHVGPLPPAPSPRERIHAVLRLGAAAVLAEHVTAAGLLDAARRSGVRVVARPDAPVLVPGTRADLAVFDADGGCLATVVAGRVLHRRA